MISQPDDPGWVGCRRCGSLEYRTLRTYPSLEGVYRIHFCTVCKRRFGSLAVYLNDETDASGDFTRLSDMALPVQPKQ